MNKKGFTLIELMIVVAIIGILAAIAIPKIQTVMACGGGKQYSQACLQLKARWAATADKDETIQLNGHTYKRQD